MADASRVTGADIVRGSKLIHLPRMDNDDFTAFDNRVSKARFDAMVDAGYGTLPHSDVKADTYYLLAG